MAGILHSSSKIKHKSIKIGLIALRVIVLVMILKTKLVIISGAIYRSSPSPPAWPTVLEPLFQFRQFDARQSFNKGKTYRTSQVSTR